MKTYNNIQTFVFQVLQEYSSWASGNDALQMLSITPTRNIYAENFGK